MTFTESKLVDAIDQLNQLHGLDRMTRGELDQLTHAHREGYYLRYGSHTKVELVLGHKMPARDGVYLKKIAAEAPRVLLVVVKALIAAESASQPDLKWSYDDRRWWTPSPSGEYMVPLESATHNRGPYGDAIKGAISSAFGVNKDEIRTSKG